VNYFQPQGAREILAGSLLAGGEEVIFRGVLLEYLVDSARQATGVAVALSRRLRVDARPAAAALAFHAVGRLGQRRTGRHYLWSDSVVVAMIVHILHDAAGFSLFSYQRRSGWLL
jgi:membrane protease YdiL (CAAX protease family)